MSLTALVCHKTPVRERLAVDFPRPKLRLKAELRVPSVAPNRPLLGTAYDYLFRFHLLRAIPFAVARSWVAERAHKQISAYGDAGILVWTGKDVLASGEIRDRMSQIIRRAQRLLAAFVAGEPLSTSLIRSAINLAHCDPYYRAGRIDERFGQPLPAQVIELGRLIEATDCSQFRAERLCLLNPTFGEGSKLIGGADADLLLDDMLIDVKTTATLKIRTEDWRQLIGYAALNEHFPIGGGEQPVPIRRVGFYFSRHGYLASWPLTELVDEVKFAAFAAWLRNYVTETHARRVARRAQFEQEMAEWRAQEERREQRERAHRAKRRKRTKARPRSKVKAKKKAPTRSECKQAIALAVRQPRCFAKGKFWDESLTLRT